MASRPDLGVKHACEECGAKFYDFGQADRSCPKCGTPAAQSADRRKKKKKAEARQQRKDAAEARRKAKKAEAEGVDVDVDDDDDGVDELDLTEDKPNFEGATEEDSDDNDAAASPNLAATGDDEEEEELPESSIDMASEEDGQQANLTDLDAEDEDTDLNELKNANLEDD